jgi:hypothetical protein
VLSHPNKFWRIPHGSICHPEGYLLKKEFGQEFGKWSGKNLCIAEICQGFMTFSYDFKKILLIKLTNHNF